MRVPVGVACFANDALPSIRPLAERQYPTIESWHEYDTGGHHAAQEVPDLLVNDLREFFAPLRA